MYTIIIAICLLSHLALDYTYALGITSECREQFIQQTRLRDQCHNRLTTLNEFLHDFNTTVIDFSGNDEDLPAVEEFFTQYCGIMPQFLKCFDISDDVSAECRTQIPNREVKMNIFQILSSVARFACENDAEVLKKILPHDGFRFLFLNDEFDQWVAVAKDFQSVNDLCLALDRSFPYIEKTMKDHPNKDIIVISREALHRFISISNCGM